jgi:hypothetical protein
MSHKVLDYSFARLSPVYFDTPASRPGLPEPVAGP